MCLATLCFVRNHVSCHCFVVINCAWCNLSCISILRGHEDRIWAVAFSSDGQWLATGGVDTSIRIWNVPRLRRTSYAPDHGGEDENAATVDKTEPLTWDATDAARVLEGRAGRIKCLCFSPRCHLWLASGSDQGVIKVSVRYSITAYRFYLTHCLEQATSV